MGFRVKKSYDFFKSLLTTFKAYIFEAACEVLKIGLESKSKPPEPIKACPNQ